MEIKRTITLSDDEAMAVYREVEESLLFTDALSVIAADGRIARKESAEKRSSALIEFFKGNHDWNTSRADAWDGAVESYLWLYPEDGFPANPAIDGHLGARLQDDGTPYGGTSYSGERLIDFVSENYRPIDYESLTLERLNEDLKSCGIKPIE